MAEAVILGLRMCKGVCLEDVQSDFGLKPSEHYYRQIEDLVNAGLLDYNDRYIRLTRRGRLLSNEMRVFRPTEASELNRGYLFITNMELINKG